MADNKEEILHKIRQGRFIENNGRVIRMINITRITYMRLSDCLYALGDIAEADFLDCINFLSCAEYIELRTIKGKQPAKLSDCNYEDLEAKLTQKGIRLTSGHVVDDLIDM